MTEPPPMQQDDQGENSEYSYQALQEDRNAEAIRWGRQAVSLSPKISEYWFNLGVAYERESIHVEAADAYLRAFELNPRDAEIKAAVNRTEGAVSGSKPNSISSP